MDDVISRQAVLDVVFESRKNFNNEFDQGFFVDKIRDLPSVTPQDPKTIQEKQAESEKYQKAYDDGYDNGYAQARFDYEQEPKTEWIPIEWRPFGKNGYPKPEDEYKHFLTIDDKGEITIQNFLLSLDEEPQPYFTGMRKIIAWMPLPEPYKADREVRI